MKVPPEVIVGLIAAVAALLVQVVNKYGAKADRAAKEVADRFQEVERVANMRAADLESARDERDTAWAEARGLREALRVLERQQAALLADLTSVAQVVRDEVTREAIATEHAIRLAELDPPDRA